MCDDEDDELCRYFFGELSDAERAAFEERLKNEPDLAERFQRHCECAAHGGAEGCPEANREDLPIPRDLVGRTTRAILEDHLERASECVGRKRFNLAEVIAVGVAATFLGGLILPAIEASRESSRRDQCAFNLANVGKGLWGYAEDHGHFPKIGLTQNAGLFTVLLTEGEYLDDELLQKSIVCPSSNLSQLIADGKLKVFIPSREDLHAASADQLLELQRVMAGSYAYRIGYFRGRDFIPFGGGVNSGCRSAVLADSPSLTSVTEIVSRHHGKCGQNILFEDGHVAFVTGCWAPDDVDHLYLNDESQLAAGSNPSDTVLAPSDVTPLGVQLIEIGE